MRAIAYDLEGPVSNLDHAYRVSARLPGGEHLFRACSEFVISQIRRGDSRFVYGDTLQLLVPFLLEGNVEEGNLVEVSREAGLVPGIRELFSSLPETPSIVSTSYQHHALRLARELGLPGERVYATPLPFRRLRLAITREDLRLVSATRERIVQAEGEGARWLLGSLFESFSPSFRTALAEVRVVGGRRKTEALTKLLGSSPLEHAFVVGDSITDADVLGAVNEAGGVAVAWNANSHALAAATCAVAATDALSMQPLIEAWLQGGRAAVREWILAAAGYQGGPCYHWMHGDSDGLRELHERFRILCRGAETAQLH